MQSDPHNFPAWLSEKDQETWPSARNALNNAWREHYAEEDFEPYESQLRFGHGAARHFGHEAWDEGLESQLQPVWKGDWNLDKGYIRRGFELSRKGLISKPFESLPETARSQPTVSNQMLEVSPETSSLHSPGL